MKKRRKFGANQAIRNLDETHTHTHEREGEYKFFEPPPTM
jgi:plastocyanin